MTLVFGQHRVKMFDQRELICDTKGCDRDARHIRRQFVFVELRVEIRDPGLQLATVGQTLFKLPVERTVLGFPGIVRVVSQVCWHICYLRRQLLDTVLDADRILREGVDSGQSSCFGHARIAATHDGVGIGVLGCDFVYSSCRTTCPPVSKPLFHCRWQPRAVCR
jgi:hypothetical protein